MVFGDKHEKPKRILLAAVTVEPGKGGIALVSRVLRRVLEENGDAFAVLFDFGDKDRDVVNVVHQRGDRLARDSGGPDRAVGRAGFHVTGEFRVQFVEPQELDDHVL